MKDNELKQKLSKLHALHYGAKTDGERQSAIKAKARILKKIESLNSANKHIEYKFSLKNNNNVEIFIDLLNRYQIEEYRKPKIKENIIIAKVPSIFVDNILWPEYLATPNRRRF